METVKAAGEWTLDVLGLPFGSPDNRDSDGEFFSAQTKTHDDKFALPIVVYFHGYDDVGKPSGSPHYIGKAVSAERRTDGIWYRVLLDKTNEFAKRVWDAAKEGIARASSGSVAHLVRKASDGHILEWPVAELSVFDAVGKRQPANRYAVALPVMKAMYIEAGIPCPVDISGPEGDLSGVDGTSTDKAPEPDTDTEAIKMKGNTTMETEIEIAVAKALKAQQDAQEAAAKAEKEKQEFAQAAVKAAEAQWAAKAAESGRLPSPGIPAVVDNSTWKYDNTETGDLAFMVATLGEAQRSGRSKRGVSIDAVKALAYRLESAEARQREFSSVAGHSMKMAGVKANELNQSTLASYGDEWVGVAYSGALWESIRQATAVVQRVPMIEFPAGAESLVIPLESTDPIWYNVAQAADLSANPGGVVTNTVTASRLGTANTTMTLAKLGARVIWTGELEEDSVLPFVSQLRAQLAISGAEYLESAVIDGDTATGNQVNVNNIAGQPSGAEWWATVNGFRKLALVTNTANSRDGGALTSGDFLETVKLMGVGGSNAADMARVSFILGSAVHYKALELADVKTRDVFNGATIENGRLTRIYGYDIMMSHHMHKQSANRLANSAGKIDQNVVGNNTTGALLAVRWDQWQMGFRRRMTIETTRIPAADATEIVAMMRFGLIHRDNEASAVSYNITV